MYGKHHNKLKVVLISFLSVLLLAGVSQSQGGPGKGGGGPPADKGGGPPPGKGGGGGHVTGAGNNLSWPVVLPEYSYFNPIVLRDDGITEEPPFSRLEGTYVDDETGRWYEQGVVGNVWQTKSYSIPPGMERKLFVDLIDWGDNLEAVDWNLRAPIRVETVLFLQLETDQAVPMMPAFQMKSLYGTERDEVFGTNGTLVEPNIEVDLDEDGVSELVPHATVYTDRARLTIQKVAELAEEGQFVLQWSEAIHSWVTFEPNPELPGPVIFNSAVYEAEDGPGYYSAEVNGSGKVIFGYNWQTKKPDQNAGTGIYRLTFSLDQSMGPNTRFDDQTSILRPLEGEEVEAEDTGGGGVAEVEVGTDYEGKSYEITYIDVRVEAKPGGGGKGGK